MTWWRTATCTLCCLAAAGCGCLRGATVARRGEKRGGRGRGGLGGDERGLGARVRRSRWRLGRTGDYGRGGGGGGTVRDLDDEGKQQSAPGGHSWALTRPGHRYYRLTFALPLPYLCPRLTNPPLPSATRVDVDSLPDPRPGSSLAASRTTSLASALFDPEQVSSAHTAVAPSSHRLKRRERARKTGFSARAAAESTSQRAPPQACLSLPRGNNVRHPTPLTIRERAQTPKMLARSDTSASADKAVANVSLASNQGAQEEREAHRSWTCSSARSCCQRKPASA